MERIYREGIYMSWLFFVCWIDQIVITDKV